MPPPCHLPQVNAQHSFPFVSGWHAPRDTESVASRQSSVQEDIALHHPVTSIWGDEPVPWLPRSHAWGCDIGNNTQSPLWSSVDQSWLAGRPSRHQHHPPCLESVKNRAAGPVCADVSDKMQTSQAASQAVQACTSDSQTWNLLFEDPRRRIRPADSSSCLVEGPKGQLLLCLL